MCTWVRWANVGMDEILWLCWTWNFVYTVYCGECVEGGIRRVLQDERIGMYLLAARIILRITCSHDSAKPNHLATQW